MLSPLESPIIYIGMSQLYEPLTAVVLYWHLRGCGGAILSFILIIERACQQTRASSECELQTRHSCKQSTFLKRHIQIKHKQSTSRHLHCCAIPQTLSKSIRMDLDRILWIVTLVAIRNCTVFLFLNSMSRRLQEHCWNQSSWTLELIQSLFWFVA